MGSTTSSSITPSSAAARDSNPRHNRKLQETTMRKRARNHPVTCEALEGRRMFIAYVVNGTVADDAISISIDEGTNRIISSVNGISDAGSDLIFNSIEINGMVGNDTIS